MKLQIGDMIRCIRTFHTSYMIKRILKEDYHKCPKLLYERFDIGDFIFIDKNSKYILKYIQTSNKNDYAVFEYENNIYEDSYMIVDLKFNIFEFSTKERISSEYNFEIDMKHRRCMNINKLLL